MTHTTVMGFGTKSASSNDKLRGVHKRRAVFATYRPVGHTCPSSCALLDAGCYAQGGNVALHSRRGAPIEAGGKGATFDPLAWALALPQDALVRWNVSGDVVGPDGSVYRDTIKRAHKLRPDLVGWTYTHAWRDPDVAAWAASLPGNVNCVASLDDPTDAAEARAMGWTTVSSVVPTKDGQSFTDTEAREIKRAASRVRTTALPCPAQRVEVGCADCMACARPGAHVVFAAHGSSTRRAQNALQTHRSTKGHPALPLA